MASTENKESLNSLDQILEICEQDAVIFDGTTSVFTMGQEIPSIRPHSIEELVLWLESKGVTRNEEGSYWGRVGDFVVHGQMDSSRDAPGRSPLDEPTNYFRITVNRQPE